MSEFQSFYEDLRDEIAVCPQCGGREFFTWEDEDEPDAECWACERCGKDFIFQFPPEGETEPYEMPDWSDPDIEEI